MTYENFKQEVQNSRPRLALELLVPVLDDLMSEVAALKAKVEAVEDHGCKPDCCSEAEPEVVAEDKPVAKKAPAKKAAASKAAPKEDSDPAPAE